MISVFRTCTKERRIQRIRKIDIFFIGIIDQRRRTVNFDAGNGLDGINVIFSGGDKTNGDAVASDFRSADQLCDDFDRITVGVGCSGKECFRRDAVIDADLTSFDAIENDIIINPFGIQRDIFRRHYGKVVFVCQSTVGKPSDKGFSGECRLFGRSNFRSATLRNGIYIASSVRYEGNCVGIRNPFRIEHGIFRFIPVPHGIALRIGILCTGATYAIVPSSESITVSCKASGKGERRIKRYRHRAVCGSSSHRSGCSVDGNRSGTGRTVAVCASYHII